MTSAGALPKYEVFAVRYATAERRRSEHFIVRDVHDGRMPIDYFGTEHIDRSTAQYTLTIG